MDGVTVLIREWTLLKVKQRELPYYNIKNCEITDESNSS